MRIIRCIDCNYKVITGSGDRKRCESCAEEERNRQDKEYRNSSHGRKVRKKWDYKFSRSRKGREKQRRENHSEAGRKAKREWYWRRAGIIGLTWEKWKQDKRKGCRFKFLGNCGGKLGADHDHKTGQYRGPLCLVHNHGLGALGDSAKNLKRILKVLES